MSWLGVNNTTARELFVPVPAPEAFAALRKVAADRHKLTAADDFTLAVTFSVKSTGWTWGENVSGQVVPVDGGSTIKLSIAPKAGGQVLQGGKNAKIADSLFAEVTAILRANR